MTPMIRHRPIARRLAMLFANNNENGWRDPQLKFRADLQSSLIFTQGAGSPTFTRADGADGRATFTDFEGRIVPVRAGEARFQGARRVRNLLTYTEDFSNAAWATYDGLTKVGVVVGVGPNGESAMELSFGSGALASLYQNATLVNGNTYVTRIAVRAKSGTTTIQHQISDGVTADLKTITLTEAWVVISVKRTAAGTSGNVGILNNATADSGNIYILNAQLEDVTGQSNQNPSEYVSVGVLSAPYHGAGVDGVKYFDTLNGNTVASNVVTENTGARITSSTAKWGQLPNSGSSRFTTPDAAANSITGDIDLRAYAAATDWTPSDYRSFIGKWGAGGYSYWFALDSSGKFIFQKSVDGTLGNIKTALSSVATGFTDGTAHWVRMTYATAPGDVKFYTSEDGVTWTQLGTTQTVTASALYDGTQAVNVGGSDGISYPWDGRIYRAQIYNGIAGTLAVDFNPNDYTSGSTFASSTTGETWTLNGSVKVFGSTAATYGIPSQWDSKGPFGYLSEGSRTNLVAYSQDFSNAAWTKFNTPTISSATTTLGTLSLDTINDDSAATAKAVFAVVASAFTGDGTKAVSIYVRQGTSASSVIQLYDLTAGTDRLRAVITWSAGVPVVTMGVGANLTGSPQAVGNGIYRLLLTATGVVAANSNRIGVWPATNDAYAAGSTGTIEAGGFMAEDATFSGSYIPTTSAAVTRAADSLAYTAAGNISGTVGTCCAEVVVPNVNTTTGVEIISTTTDPLYISTTSKISIYDGTTQSNDSSFTGSSALRKVASYWGGSTMGTVLDGVAGSGAAFDGALSVAATFGVGCTIAGATQPFGTIRNVRIFNRVLTAQQINQVQA